MSRTSGDMTDAQREACAIVQRLREDISEEANGYRRQTLKAAAETIEKLATALAAKDAELGEWKTAQARSAVAYEAVRKRAERAEAQLAEARKALEPFADIANLIDSETEGMSETDELELHFHDYLMASWPVSLFRAVRHAFGRKA
jgi:molecular chaperone GrpE (heat shock protein)